MKRVAIEPDGEMQLTDDQKIAAEKIENVIATGGFLVVAGFAGTGKSKLLSWAVQALRDSGVPHKVVCPTGRAAARQRALGIDAQTIHAWRYIPKVDKTGELIGFKLRDMDDLPPHFVLLVDEGSMVGPTVAKDVIETVSPGMPGRSVVIFGDYAQLPPILSSEERARFGPTFCLLLQRYARHLGMTDYTELQQVLRQAQDNPVLQLATALRSGTEPPFPDSKHLLIMRKHRDYTEEIMRSFDPDADRIVLTWMNRDRRKLNATAREARGFADPIEPGERLIVLANHRVYGLSNGDLIDVVAIVEIVETAWKPVYIAVYPDPYTGETIEGTMIMQTEADTEKGALSVFAQARKIEKAHPDLGLPLVVDYGYVLTVHKAQGAEFQHVHIYAPDFMLKRLGSQATNWLYTAVTRTRDQLHFAGGSKIAYLLGG